MQLTDMPIPFRLFVLVLGLGYLVVSWMSENYVLPRLAKLVGQAKQWLGRSPKQRKMYKVIGERMQI
jgi:hypothetical protein